MSRARKPTLAAVPPSNEGTVPKPMVEFLFHADAIATELDGLDVALQVIEGKITQTELQPLIDRARSASELIRFSVASMRSVDDGENFFALKGEV